MKEEASILSEISSLEKLVAFYFESVKEGMWLTEDLQIRITERLKKCKSLA